MRLRKHTLTARPLRKVRIMAEMEYVSVEVHREFAERIDAENKRQNARLEKLEDTISKISELTSSVKVLAVNMETMTKEQIKQGERLQAIEEKPANNWDKLVWAVIGAVVAGIIAYIMAQVGIR